MQEPVINPNELKLDEISRHIESLKDKYEPEKDAREFLSMLFLVLAIIYLAMRVLRLI